MLRRFSTRALALRDKWNSIIHPVSERVSQTSRLTYAIKDNFATVNDITSCASQMLENYPSPFDATVATLLRDEGIQDIGRANLDEFGMGSANTNTFYGPVANPAYPDENRVPGGSSGGSAAAVAAELCDFSLGTDTGGSVRLPAAYCRVYGFKPSYGRISRWGVVPYAQTLDTVGILARDTSTINEVFDIIDKYDEKDPTSLPEELRGQVSEQPEKYTIGVPEEFVLDELTDDTKDKWANLLELLRQQGHDVVTVSIPAIIDSLPSYYTIATAEASSNLSRYDGVRFGYSGGSGDFLDILHRSRTSLGSEVKSRIILGNYSLSSASGGHYRKANEVRRLLAQEFNSAFRKEHCLMKTPTEGICDVMVYPTAFGEPPSIEGYEELMKENFVTGYINDIMTIPASLAGLPTMSVPYGNGFQVTGQFNDDNTVLAVAREVELLMSRS